MALLEAQRAELKEALQSLVDDLDDQLRGSAEAAQPVALDQTAVGRVSRIDAIQQQKMVEASRQALRRRLQRIHSALQRFEGDEYGDCAECGEEVGYARLKARPESLFCIACQRARERRR